MEHLFRDLDQNFDPQLSARLSNWAERDPHEYILAAHRNRDAAIRRLRRYIPDGEIRILELVTTVHPLIVYFENSRFYLISPHYINYIPEGSNPEGLLEGASHTELKVLYRSVWLRQGQMYKDIYNYLEYLCIYYNLLTDSEYQEIYNKLCNVPRDNHQNTSYTILRQRGFLNTEGRSTAQFVDEITRVWYDPLVEIPWPLTEEETSGWGEEQILGEGAITRGPGILAQVPGWRGAYRITSDTASLFEAEDISVEQGDRWVALEGGRRRRRRSNRPFGEDSVSITIPEDSRAGFLSSRSPGTLTVQQMQAYVEMMFGPKYSETEKELLTTGILRL